MTQPRLPQFTDYQHIGAYMRDLRLYYALDVPQVAERLHIRAKYIQAIEEGRLEQMPGKVYARGYIVTYAEFLGLDAEAIATQYMGEGTKARDVHYFVPEPKRTKLQRSQKRLPYGVLGLAVVLGLAYVYWPAGDEDGRPNSVQDVPQALIEAMRNGVMPVADNTDCLMGGGWMACVQRMGEPVPGPMFVAPVVRPFVDATSLPVAPVVEEEEVAEPEAPTPPAPAPQAPKPEAKPPEVKKPEPKKPEAKKPESSPPKPEVKPTTEAVEEVAPFVPQAPVEAPKPDDVPAADSLDTGPNAGNPRWWRRGFEEQAPDPNDPNVLRDEPWSPRGRR